jgi:hypothetical protein
VRHDQATEIVLDTMAKQATTKQNNPPTDIREIVG